MQAARAALQAAHKQAGIPWYGGRPKRIRVESMAEQARALLAPLVEAVPGDDGVHRDIESMAPAEVLGAATGKAVVRLYEACSMHFIEGDHKHNRLILDAALGTLTRALRINDQEFQRTKSDRLGELLERIRGMTAPAAKE